MMNSWTGILKVAGLLAVVLLACGSQAKADGVQFAFTGGPGQSITFEIPTMPTPVHYVLGDRFQLYGVAGTYDGQATAFTLTFFTPANVNYKQWGVAVVSPLMSLPYFFGTGGTTLFSGTTNAPDFTSSGGITFPVAWTGGNWSSFADAGLMTEVPEPGTLLLLGMGGMALLGYRRKRIA